MATRKKKSRRGGPLKITEAAVDLCVELMARRLTKAAIKASLSKQFKIAARSCETVFARARARMLERSGRDKDEHRTDALAFYEAVIRDDGSPAVTDADGKVIKAATPGPTAREKLHAQERIDRLLGLEVPQQVQLTGAGGGPIKAIVGIDLETL